MVVYDNTYTEKTETSLKFWKEPGNFQERPYYRCVDRHKTLLKAHKITSHDHTDKNINLWKKIQIYFFLLKKKKKYKSTF